MNRIIKKNQKTSIVKNLIYAHIEKNIKEYFIVSVLFIIGVIVGVIFINNASETQQEEISQHLGHFVTSLQNNQVIDDGDLLMDSIVQNVLLALLLWFMGSTLIGVFAVYAIVAFRGFVLGYTIASAISFFGMGRGTLFVSTSLLLQAIIFIPAILAIAVSGMNLYNSIVKDRRIENIKLEVLRHTAFSALMLVFLILSSLVEVHISKNLLMLCIYFF